MKNLILLISGIVMATMVSAVPTDKVCPVKGQMYSRCAGACTPTCARPNIPCILMCVPGCACPQGQVVDEIKNECVPQDQCPPATIWEEVAAQATLCYDQNGVGHRPGERFYYECNACTCGRDGRAACTRKACDPNACYDQNGMGHQPGESFRIECNTCTCVRDGKAACTKKACDRCPVKGQKVTQCGGACTPTCANPNPICPRICIPGCQCPQGQVVDEKKKKCVPRDQCSSVCPVEGQKVTQCGGACTPTCANPNPICPRICIPGCQCPQGQVVDENKKECVSQDQCSSVCTVKGQTITRCGGACTPTCANPNPICPRICIPGCQCPQGQVVDEKKKECVPQDQCSSATLCYDQNGVGHQPGEHFYYECNGCTCGRDGRAACTKKGCDPNACYDQNGVGHQPGESFRIECNTCTCVRDGKAACTKKACDLSDQLRKDDEIAAKQGADVCSLPPAPGPCLAHMPRYYYNTASQQCEMFVYGGCAGNPNNFETLKQCEWMCAISATSNENAVAQEVAALLRLLMEENKMVAEQNNRRFKG